MAEPPAARTAGEGRPCPACGNVSDWRRTAEKNGYTWRACGQCGSLSVSRLPTAEEQTAFYAGYYADHIPEAPDFFRERLREIVAGFGPPRTGRILDVGFGDGTLLNAAAALGWECWGTEVSASALAHGRERSWRVLSGDLPGLDLPAAGFDVLCMVEVLEHLPHPRGYLEAAARLLRPGGLLFATTPNGASLNARVLGVKWSVFSAPEHLQLFSRRGLRTALNGSGLVVNHILTHGLNPCELRPAARTGKDPGSPSRNDAGFRLNREWSRGGARRLIKQTVNGTLSILGLGDTLKVHACRPDPARRLRPSGEDTPHA